MATSTPREAARRLGSSASALHVRVLVGLLPLLACKHTGGADVAAAPGAKAEAAAENAQEADADADAPIGWTRHRSDDGLVSALFPSNWELQAERGVEETSGLGFAEWQAEDLDTIYYLGVEEMGGAVEPGSGQENELFMSFVQENVQALNGQLLGQRRVFLRGFPGIGYDLGIQTEDGGSAQLSGRMFLIGDRRILAFVYSPDAIADEAALFLNGLRLESALEEVVLSAHGPGWGELAMGDAAWIHSEHRPALDWYARAIASGMFSPEFAGSIEDRRARIFFGLGDFESARASLEAAARNGFESHLGARMRAAMLIQDEDYEAAVEELDRVLADGGGDIDLLRARLQARAGSLGAARRRLREGTGSSGDVDVLLNSFSVEVDQALEADPGAADLRVWRALVRDSLGDRTGALIDLRRAAAAEPDTFGARLAWAWELLGTPAPERSRPLAKWLAARAPADAILRRILGELWAVSEDYDAAEPIFLSLSGPAEASAELVCRTGQLYVRMKREADAKTHFERGHTLAPDVLACRNSLAWLLATARDGDVRDGKRAVELAETFRFDGARRRDHAEMTAGRVDTLAAAYAEAARWDEAVATQRLALELAREEGRSPEDLTDFEARLEAYEAKRPWRETYESPTP